MDEDHLVPLAVSVEAVHRLARPAERDLDVVVPHQEPAAADRVSRLGDVPGREVAVCVRGRRPFVAHDRLERAELLDTARRGDVVEDRFVPGEPLEPHHLLRQQRPVLAVLDVPLARDVA
jgi:hypothetical protein